MFWLTWRQHRLTVSAVGVVLLGFAAWFLLIGNGIRGSLPTGAASNCVAMRLECGDWDTVLSVLHNLEQTLLPVLPAFIGAFLGAPMLSREFEQHTLRYTWTQGVSRGRWLGTKVLLLGAAVVLGATVFSAAYLWLLAPGVPEAGRFEHFTLSLPVFPVLCLFGFALGVLAGTLTKQLLVSMAIALAGFLVVFLPFPGLLREGYLSPVRMNADSYRYGTSDGWLTDFVYVHRSGAEFDIWGAMQKAGIPNIGSVGSETTERLRDMGFSEYYLLQPADRFWTFQFIESGVFLLFAAACVALTFWLLRRKPV